MVGYGIFPRIIFSAPDGVHNAVNTPFYIKINPSDPRVGATLAQERWEFWNRHFWYWPLALTIGFIGYFFHPYFIAAGPIIATMFVTNRWFERRTEIMGHTIESVTATTCYGDVTDLYMLKEANDMATLYSCFHGYSVEQINEQMIKKLAKARKWVYKNLRTITQDIQRIKNS